MLCKQCKTNRKKKDFYGKIICFKCEYTRKLKMVKNKKMTRYCRICETLLPSNKWVYCGRECAVQGEKKQKREHWTAMIA